MWSKVTLVAAVATVFVSTGPVIAQDVWKGTVFIDAKTAGCVAADIDDVGTRLEMLFAPGGVGTNTNTLVRIGRFDEVYSVAMSGRFVPSGYTANYIGPFGEFQTWSGTINIAQTTPVETAITPTTKSITVVVRASNVHNVPTCTVTLRGVVLKLSLD